MFGWTIVSTNPICWRWQPLHWQCWNVFGLGFDKLWKCGLHKIILHQDDISYLAARSNFFYLCSSSRHNYFSDAFTFSPGFYISSCFSFFGISCLFHFLSRFDITVSVFVNCELWLVQLIRGKGGKDKRKFFLPIFSTERENDAQHQPQQLFFEVLDIKQLLFDWTTFFILSLKMRRFS